MTLNDLLSGEPWMDDLERQTAARIVQAMQREFADREIPETTFLALRVQDYLLHYTLCRRLERSLTPAAESACPVSVVPTLAEHIGKCRDRLRKAHKELEDAAAKLAPPPPPPPPPQRPFNLPDFYKPILEEVGVDLINDPELFRGLTTKEDEFGRVCFVDFKDAPEQFRGWSYRPAQQDPMPSPDPPVPAHQPPLMASEDAPPNQIQSCHPRGPSAREHPDGGTVP